LRQAGGFPALAHECTENGGVASPEIFVSL
jgi:hypothetical protein